MAMTGVDTFDTTVQKTEEWLHQISDRLNWNSRQRSLHALRATLHALRDRLTIDEGAHLSAQLPIMVRGLYYENWRPSDIPVKSRTKEDFLNRIREQYQQEPDTDVEAVAKAVFSVVRSRLDPGEASAVKNMLPKDLIELWEE